MDHLNGPEGRPYNGVPFNDAITRLYEHAAAAIVHYDVLPQLEASANMTRACNHGIKHKIDKTSRPAVQGELHIERSFREWQLPLYYHSLGWEHIHLEKKPSGEKEHMLPKRRCVSNLVRVFPAHQLTGLKQPSCASR